MSRRKDSDVVILIRAWSEIDAIALRAVVTVATEGRPNQRMAATSTDSVCSIVRNALRSLERG